MRNAIIALLLVALLPSQAGAFSTDELLALVAMPLAVAAVSEIAGVPERELFDLVAMLNNADVPPVQFIEVIRYVPVALVVENEQPDFVPFVRTQFDAGVRGPALVTVIEQRLRTIEPTIVIAQPATQTIIVDDTFIPPVVVTRVAKVRRSHPHGGPPGQVKKVLGVQTGAEVVHRDRRDKRTVVVVKEGDRDDDKNKGDRGRGNDKGDKGKGKGKSKGKDD